MRCLKILFCVGFFLSAHTLRAQEDARRDSPQPEHILPAHAREDDRRHSLALQWSVYIPSDGGFLNHATTVSPSLEWEWRISDAVCVGAGIGYTHGAEHNYTRDTYEGDLVTGSSDRQLTLIPLTAHLRWFPVAFLQHRLQPFIGAGIGAQHATFRIEGELINESKVRSWGVVVRPEAGVRFSPRYNGRICIEIRCAWQYASNRFPVMNVQSLQGIQIGAGVRYRF